MYAPETRMLTGVNGSRRISRSWHRILMRLARRPAQMVPYELLIGALWPNPTDEPDDARKVLKVLVCNLRALLRKLGASERIDTCWGDGLVLLRDGPAQRMVLLTDAQLDDLARLIATHPDAETAARMREAIPGSGPGTGAAGMVL
jgi:DNA-binding SARP family transcriptional activator